MNLTLIPYIYTVIILKFILKTLLFKFLKIDITNIKIKNYNQIANYFKV